MYWAVMDSCKQEIVQKKPNDWFMIKKNICDGYEMHTNWLLYLTSPYISEQEVDHLSSNFLLIFWEAAH